MVRLHSVEEADVNDQLPTASGLLESGKWRPSSSGDCELVKIFVIFCPRALAD